MKIITRTLLFFLIALCFTIGVSSVSGATFVVNTTGDTIDAIAGDGSCADAGSNCSLRAAISEANALAGPDIITLGAFVYTQSLGPSEENLNAGGDWDIKSNITINGAGEATTILQAVGCSAGRDRVLDVGGGITVSLNNLTIRNGCLSTVAPNLGAGIWNTGNLTLNSVTVRDNLVQNFEGGASGGGIFNWSGSLTLNNSTVTNNSVTGAMFGGTAGGGIYSQSSSPIVITGSSISGNQAGGFNQSSFGGGMYVLRAGSLTITDSHFDNNTVSGTSGGNAGGGLSVVSDTGSMTVNITGSTFNTNHGTSPDSGGVGAYFSTLESTNASLAVTMDRTSVNGNIGTGAGVGILVNPHRSGISLEVNNSTISSNTGGGAHGGGVRLTNNGGRPESTISARFTNSTLSSNSVSSGGGGLSVQQVSASVQATLDYCTVTGNSAGSAAGGLDNFGSGTINILRTVVAGNTAPANPDIFFSVNSFDFNHIGDPGGAVITGDTTHNTTGDAMLGALQDNGGPTLTHLPFFGSPLLNAISGSLCGTLPPNDQRGVTRPQGAACDKGSVERTAYPAGPWSLSGLVRTTTGQPIRNAAVTISGGALPAPVTVFTGNFGTYQFTNLTGEEYTVSVSVKRYHFNEANQVFALGANIIDADFIANAPFGREALDLEPVKEKGLK
ncbi:MAG TPA: choice-of-anchor Q domain-containing protein [Pyrinomonadaceae bacterium]|jgi:CSLREA domain-containing protein|nr:choice-of-anchor Q domain-containing protein [Pyrinomonadaceae bacterium]